MGRGSRRSARSGHAAGGPWDCRGERRRATAGPNRGAGTRGAACLTDDGADCIGGAGTMTEARSEQASQQLRVDEPAGSAGPRGCPSPEWQMGLRTPGTKERASMWDPVDKPCPTPASINNGIMSPVRPRRNPDVADDCILSCETNSVTRSRGTLSTRRVSLPGAGPGGPRAWPFPLRATPGSRRLWWGRQMAGRHPAEGPRARQNHGSPGAPARRPDLQFEASNRSMQVPRSPGLRARRSAAVATDRFGAAGGAVADEAAGSTRGSGGAAAVAAARAAWAAAGVRGRVRPAPRHSGSARERERRRQAPGPERDAVADWTDGAQPAHSTAERSGSAGSEGPKRVPERSLTRRTAGHPAVDAPRCDLPCRSGLAGGSEWPATVPFGREAVARGSGTGSRPRMRVPAGRARAGAA